MRVILSILLVQGLLAVLTLSFTQSASTNERSDLAVESSALPMLRPIGLRSGGSMRQALIAAQNDDWERAFEIAVGVGDVAPIIIEWQRLRAGNADLPDYLRFLDRYGDWPGLKLLRRKGEASIPESARAHDVIRYFQPQPPQTGHGALRLAEAYARSGERGKARTELIQAWKSMRMTAEEEAAILQKHAATVRPHHAERLNHALWLKDTSLAQRMVPRVNPRLRKLAEARLALQRRTESASRLVTALPRQSTSDPGLARDRMEWNVAEGRNDVAVDIMLASSGSRASLGRPEAWADRRRRLARQEMRDGNRKRAYRLASSHRLDSESAAYADLEWLSGYLALRYLDQPTRALGHFRNFREAVFSAISLGKAGYWEGRALAAAGKAAEAERVLLETAKRYQTSFYGLLAAEITGVPMDGELVGSPGNVPWRGRNFLQSSVLKAALLFRDANQGWEPSWFLRHLAESMGPDDLSALAGFALSLHDPYIAVRVGKQAASQGVTVHNALYPLPDLNQERYLVPQALVLAIARQESEFYPDGISGADARGMMQVLPSTAKEMAGDIGISYDKARLTSDPTYNVTLGSAYLAELIEEFGSGVALVAAGYNAGPGRARRWIEEIGDPRNPRMNVVDWIEHIPYRETRNYVMRVAESVIVYRARLNGRPVPIDLSRRLVNQ